MKMNIVETRKPYFFHFELYFIITFHIQIIKTRRSLFPHNRIIKFMK